MNIPVMPSTWPCWTAEAAPAFATMEAPAAVVKEVNVAGSTGAKGPAKQEVAARHTKRVTKPKETILIGAGTVGSDNRYQHTVSPHN